MERMLDKLPKLLTNPDFAEAYKESASEFALAREIMMARIGAGLSQQDLADKMATTQSAVARLESGRHLPSMATLKKLAEATGTRLSIHLERPYASDDIDPLEKIRVNQLRTKIAKQAGSGKKGAAKTKLTSKKHRDTTTV